MTPEIATRVLNYILMFAVSLKDLLNKDRIELNQLLIKRSDNKTRNLSELMLAFLEKALNSEIIKDKISFEEIL